MILTLDIGNTFIKTGVFEDSIPVFTVKTKPDDFHSLSFKDFKLTGCAISSVVPTTTKTISEIVKDKFGFTPFVITSSSKFNLAVVYSTPDTLGVDRLCGAEGALRLFTESGRILSKNEVIITIDFGTATTINLVKHPSVFAGGIISPGIRMMFGALNKNTSQLPDVNFDEYKDIIGDSTNSAIASGVLNATAGLIGRARSFLSDDLKAEKVHTYITGGNAHAIMPHLDFEFTHEPNLVLHGVNAVYLKNNS
jgi:type III pantothenate kinase